MSSRLVNRRSLFQWLGAAALPVVAAGVPRALLPVPERERQLARRVVALFSEPASAEVVGRCYLQRHPAEASIGRLLSSICAGSGGVERLQALDRAALHAELGRVVQADFAAGATVRLEGWILSATESRLMALAALVRGRA
jgi:hypothetical protein